ncbi:MAG: GHKL domain-containing protein [Lachnoclostridium sp.]|nr:GHKL domain-containing protein [Lachnoclostridium sp.]
MSIKNKELMLFNEGLAKYNEKLEQDTKRRSLLNHNSKNILYSLSDLVNESEDKKLKKFYVEEIYPISMDIIQKEYIFENVKDILMLPLKSLVYSKLSDAHDKKILITTKVDCDKQESRMKIMDLVMVLGIFLDNAIEECEGMDNGKINMMIRNKEDGEKYVIENTIKSQIDTMLLDGGNTTKGENRGNGLQIVRDILGKYRYAENIVVINETSFQQTLLIYQEDK